MSKPVSSVRNLGPAYEAACARAGIHSAEELHDLGPDAAYARMVRAGKRPHFISFYAMVMGLQGRPWNDCKGAEKEALRARFEAIRAATPNAPEDAFEQMMADDERDRRAARAEIVADSGGTILPHEGLIR